MNGLIIVDKPKSYTSRDIVNIVGKKLKTKKIGHTGTLDPLAQGVLVLTVGRYTKLNELLVSEDKEYIAEIKLGIKTDTLDIMGQVIDEQDFNITEYDIIKVFNSLIGSYHMQVPIYSAVKVNGKRLYDYARSNKEVELPYKDVYIYSLELLEFKGDIIKFKTKVSKGTYIRSLIRDICDLLNTVGVMQSLIRTRQGVFKIENAYSLEDIENNNFQFLSIKEALEIKEYQLTKEEYLKVKNGNSINIAMWEEMLLLTYENHEIAIYQKDNNIYKAKVMLEV